jgi:regulatory protein
MSKSKKDILYKLQRYCARSEHCTQDILIKLRSWGVPEQEHEEILRSLRQDHFLDDARYALLFSTEKWVSQYWGKDKIIHHLAEKEIPEDIIQSAIHHVPDDAYRLGVFIHLSKKWESYSDSSTSQKLRKLQAFAAGRGYESELFSEWLQQRGLSDI